MSDIEKLEKAMRYKAKKPKHAYGYYSMLGQVNEPVECVIMLKKLNDAISTMYELSDAQHYLDYIWNAGTAQNKQLEERGFTEDYFDGIAEKLEELRAILFGNNLDWEGLYKELYDDLLCHEVWWRQSLEEQNRQLDCKVRKLEKGEKA